MSTLTAYLRLARVGWVLVREGVVSALPSEDMPPLARTLQKLAGLFARRLAIGMRLQTDPTVIYGIGEAYDGNITRAHLEQDTPYNTYVRAGLPPTPIAMPGADALRAATQPADGDALYFVAIGDGTGRHVFSDTLAEHQAAVRAYLKRYRERHRP